MILDLIAWITLLTSFVWLAAFLFLAVSDADLVLALKEKFGKQSDSLARKVIWITGASSGIGESMAHCLAQAGCRLILSARRELELERVKQDCISLGKNLITDHDILVLPLDISDFDSHKLAVEQALNHFQKIDVLVNNAGRSQLAAWLDVDISVDREIWHTNVLGTVSLTQEVLPHMIARKNGHIVLVSSIAGKIGVAGARSYTGAKHGLQGYFDGLRVEMAEHKVDVTVICPGPVFSQLYLKASTGKPGEVMGRVMEKGEKRMKTKRCAHLSCVAIANRLTEVWVCKQPVLFAVYCKQYLPDITMWFSVKLGSKLVMNMREGK